MIIASVRFPLRHGTRDEDITKVFEASAPKYRKVSGLLAKHYVFGSGRGGGIYLWESRAPAEQFYAPEWQAGITGRYGGPPEIEWLDNPVTVDNVAGRIIFAAAEMK
jgi:hypothetical protein